jgi:hypothetical protein
MPTEDEMTVSERPKYLKRMKPLYNKADRHEQSRMLTEMEQVTGLHRKSLLRLLHAPTLERKKHEKGRGRTYGLAVEQGILVVWESLDYHLRRTAHADIALHRPASGSLWHAATKIRKLESSSVRSARRR